ncbi:HsdR family type I site-specific deoxyribonuclease [Silvanigrella paludirubra]|uniref:Type I restriction enzyme endonuclease subunit n=1 Tax=Silvanigrella paludirubra TaxID=2499159 RepID=A0A6N6VR71_9BACT|nr:HsdR family type I site-specific deoxyribonuclease [Silvanigrella paludirubra]KAB8037563.1 HsdR family type I site-specific deoxyribonuclease [Silvanigrella paludirubra]
MSDVIGKSEKVTQNRIIDLFINELGFHYLGNWSERKGNSNIEEEFLTKYLNKNGYSKEKINVAINKLKTEANNYNRTLYQNNKEVYSLLRYGASVKIDVTKSNETIKYINWDDPQKNDFAIAEEVTLQGNNERRPDLVLYINGIAISVIELKNSRVSIGDGISQLISNQLPEFNEWFFTTTQILFAGSDAEGLKYGTIRTPEKYYLTWKEDEQENERFKLDKYILKICEKKRFIELLHDFILFDGGEKKLPRVHQYFGVKAAQEFMKRREGGIIWHTQGSGKSIVMVLLARWILENISKARVLIITDRQELDAQIKSVFESSGESIYQTSSGIDLMSKLALPTPRLFCSLVHKFGQRDVGNIDKFIEEIKSRPSIVVGELFVFVDECHRTQSGDLHDLMKAIMANAVFVGFTGTPLLKNDKNKTLDAFGKYIHTYKFSEAVADKVILDLLYEARDIDQRLSSVEKIDAWFDAKTRGLNSWQKDELKKQWSTMQRVLSSRSRMEKVVADIVFDFGVKPRLNNNRGNAILVAASIFEACKYYELFQKTVFKGNCAIVTSYNLDKRDTTKEETGANTETDRQVIYNTYFELLKNVQALPNLSKTETYEAKAKDKFKKEPANMKLLVVVDKLLTGFDAPSCTYIYIDKSMQNHGLFQAICRTNRLDGEDKVFGYIVDYKDLFKSVEKVISVYSSEIDHSTDKIDGADSDVLMNNRLNKAREKLDQALEMMFLILEPIPQPKGEWESIRYFCGNTEIATDLKDKESLRISLYKTVATFLRAYANVSDDLEAADYSQEDITRIKKQLNQAIDLRALIRRASGEELDLKAYEADMRHLLDSYIEASDPRKISPFDDVPLLELIVKSGIAEAFTQKFGNKQPKDDKSVAEVVENNIRSKIMKEHLHDPAFFERMSKLLDEVVKFRKENANKYEEYLLKVVNLAKRIQSGSASQMPSSLQTLGQKALYNNLGEQEELALTIDMTLKQVRPADWRGVQTRENVIKQALYEILKSEKEVERIFNIVFIHKEY